VRPDCAGAWAAISVTRVRCYDHNFLRFLPIFGEKMAFFSKTDVMINFFAKNANIFAKFFGENN
jgi:hypothetical protein